VAGGAAGRGGRLRGLTADTRPLRVPDFRRLWTANIITVIGAQLTVVAVPAQIYADTGSSAYVGLTGVFGLVPLVVFGLYGGALADVFDRRSILVVTTLGLIVTSGLFAAQAFAGSTNVWLLLSLFSVQQAFFAVNQPTRAALLPKLLPDELLPAANSLNMTVFQAGAIAGPLVAGILIPFTGFAWLYAADTLCLLKGRFHLTGTWQNQFDGSSGALRPIVNSDLSGFFYFTDKNNVELIVKVLNFGGEIKVFYSQLTNLKFTLNVRDSTTGRTKSYTNTAGDCGAIDSNFLASTAAVTADSTGGLASVALPATSSCQADAATLCLLDNRFAVTVTWRNQFNGASGTGKAKPLSRLTGAFAFDDPANLEILIKTLSFDGRILVLHGSLSNFEYTIRVTDTTTGIFKDYRNAAGNYCGGLDNNAF